ncbi:hypothetical protein IAD21_03468 [Abditibacteriota bacterium]|nr:hypothetical protein IAD21_03468 [Abditibacteriota bacterium]
MPVVRRELLTAGIFVFAIPFFNVLVLVFGLDLTEKCEKPMRPLIFKILVCLVALSSVAQAHNGPPFPVVVDRASGPYKVSLWADPDIGQGTLFIVLEGLGTQPLTQEPTKVEVAVQPVSKRLPEKTYAAERQNNRDSPHYYVEVPFDKQELWNLRIVLHDGPKVETVSTRVEATPDDLGPTGLLVYAFPFVAIGFVWIRAARKKSPVPASPAKEN